MQPVNESDINSPIEIVSVEHLPEYVIGFPVYVAITVRTRPNVSVNALLFADIIDLRESIGIEMVGPSGTINYVPTPIIDEETGAFGERLAAGESRRMLTDVSPLIGNTITEGEYKVQFSYVTPQKGYKANAVRIKFRKPNSAETALLTTVAENRPNFPNWALWTTSPPPKPVSTVEIKPDNPLKLNLLLRHLFFGSEPLERVDPNILNVLTDIFEPERNALKAELYKIRKDQTNYERLKKQALSTTPGLSWWFKMLDDADGAYLKTFRREPAKPALPKEE